MFVILQVKCVPCQLCWPGQRHVVSRLAGQSGVPPLRYLGFQGVEASTNFFSTVTQITGADGHTGASACLLAAGSVTASSPAVIW